MKKILFALSLFSLPLVVNAQVSTRLAIAPRLQWPNNDGYCGENSIQMCGLYYGEYISERLCRRVAGGEVLIYVNDTAALDTLSFTYSEWNPNVATPQYMGYLDWVKQFLNKKQPVIITVYVSGGTDPDYDHIIPAIGFYAKNVNTYTSTDSLTYNSNFDTIPFTRPFSNMYATRVGAGNSAPYPYYIPQGTDYGVAVTGNKDPGRVTRPVHITLDSNEEPNITLGASPCILRATIIADSLTIGKQYALLRYNDYRSVPSVNFAPSGASSTVYFTATSVTHTVIDSFMSDTAVFYRCIPYVATGINAVYTAYDGPTIYPNPSLGKITLQFGSSVSRIEIVDALGQVIQDLNVSGKGNKSVFVQNKGIYFVRFIDGDRTEVKKIEIIR